MNDCDVVVVGAGISGLSLAYFLKERGLAVELHEARAAPGGNIMTQRHDGFLYDVGPDSFVRAKPDAEALCRRIGLGESLIEPLPEGRQVYVAYEGVLHPMPEGLSLGVPTHPRALFQSELLSGVGKLRALCEPFVWRPEGQLDDESIQSFLDRRIGSEMSRRIAAPLLSGVFAGDANRLSMHAAFPQIPEYERDHGSLFWGMKAARKVDTATLRAKLRVLVRALFEGGQPPPSPFYSLKEGMGSLIARLVEVCEAPSERGSVKLHFGSAVKRLLLNRGRALGVGLRSGREVRADRVVLTGPPWVCAEVVGLGHPELRKTLLEARGAPTATVFFGLDQAKMDRQLSGSGFIVPPGEGSILASTFTHQKWEGRAPAGTALVRAFVGGARAAGPSLLEATDEQLIRLSQAELERFVGALGTPLFSRVYRYSRGTPQPEIGHAHWLRRVQGHASELPGVSLIGPGYGGVGIPDCIRAARRLAESFSEPKPPGAAE